MIQYILFTDQILLTNIMPSIVFSLFSNELEYNDKEMCVNKYLKQWNNIILKQYRINKFNKTKQSFKKHCQYWSMSISKNVDWIGSDKRGSWRCKDIFFKCIISYSFIMLY